MIDNAFKKYEKLTHELKKFEKVAVLLSGGLDSSFLLYAAKNALGNENVVAVTVVFPYTIKRCVERAKKFAEKLKVKHVIIKDDEILNDPDIQYNTKNRCYACKRRMIKLASEIKNFKLIDGTNADDLLEYRPGIKALREFEVQSPLAKVNFSKEEIRAVSKELGLEFWNLSPNTCLLTRFPYNEEINTEKLRRIERVEDLIVDCTGIESIRARFHGDLIRIETDMIKDLVSRLLDRKDCLEEIRSLGFKYVTVQIS